eukprot:6213400-Pleurochrysis_carterae.AAC.3
MQSAGFVDSVDALLAVYDSPGHTEHKLTAFAIIHAEIVLADKYSEYMDVAIKHFSEIKLAGYVSDVPPVMTWSKFVKLIHNEFAQFYTKALHVHRSKGFCGAG